MPFLSERFLDACPARYIPSECRLVWKFFNYFWFARNLSQFLWIVNLSRRAHGIVWCVCTMRLEIQAADLSVISYHQCGGINCFKEPSVILGKIMQEK